MTANEVRARVRAEEAVSHEVYSLIRAMIDERGMDVKVVLEIAHEVMICYMMDRLGADRTAEYCEFSAALIRTNLAPDPHDLASMPVSGRA